jgi:hypothetical protein
MQFVTISTVYVLYMEYICSTISMLDVQPPRGGGTDRTNSLRWGRARRHLLSLFFPTPNLTYATYTVTPKFWRVYTKAVEYAS